MSRPMNMLRTRRKDCNVKPNRRDAKVTRLDRKSSRGMLYENEELRLKTININAEVESRQSDIKKLKRENEMLKKGLWYLRDEYDKLEKLIKDKKLDFYSSSSTTSSTSEEESCTSCGEEGEEVETTQNIKNVQRTNLRNIQDQFDHLSVVTEETSAENSEQNSSRTSVPHDHWGNHASNYDKDIIQPDESYPEFMPSTGKSRTLPAQETVPLNFFSSIKTSKSFDDNHFNQVRDRLLDGTPYVSSNSVNDHPQNYENDLGGEYGHRGAPFQQFQPNGDAFLSRKIVKTNANSFYQNMVLVPKAAKPPPEARPMAKASTDLIVKIDNQNFNSNAIVFSNTPSQSTFSNGGNLEELLNDIEAISQEILKLSNLQRGTHQHAQENDMNNMDDASRFILEVESELQQPYMPILDNPIPENSQHLPMTPEKPYKSELNVVLMPNPMPLIGFDKYRNIQRSLESLNAKPIEELSASQENLCIIPPPAPLAPSEVNPNVPPPPPQIFLEENGFRRACEETETNPFFFGNLTDNYVNADYFNMRYNPDNFSRRESSEDKREKGYDAKTGSKTNLLDITSSEHVSSENEENLKFQTSKPEKAEEKKQDLHQQEVKSPKLSIRRKVSIHFKGKKEKAKKGNPDSGTPLESPKPRTPGEKKSSIFDIRFGGGDKDKDKDKEKEKHRISHQKTSSIESRVSTTETSNPEPKTPTSTDSKTSNEKKPAKKDEPLCDKKTRKSVSVSPDRNRHVHVKEQGAKKHKKHKKSDRSRMRRPSIILEPRNYRERSYSVCTDRSTMGLGLGLGSSYLYDEYSDRERTNSLSSCETNENARKLSTMSNVPLSGKVPWCGCWGNGCL